MRRAGTGEAVGNDYQGVYEHQVSGLRTFCLHRGHALRPLPVGSEERAKNQRRVGRSSQQRGHQRDGVLKEGQGAARSLTGKCGT